MFVYSGEAWVCVPIKKTLQLAFSNVLLQPTIKMRALNVTHNLLLTEYGDMNTSFSSTSAVNIYFIFAKKVELFIKIVINFKSNNFNVNFMNKTVNWCKVLQVPRYEPFIKIAY